MQENSCAEEIRLLSVRLQDSSLNTRKECFQKLKEVTDKDLNPDALRELAHFLYSTLQRYGSSSAKSRYLVSEYITSIQQRHPVASTKLLLRVVCTSAAFCAHAHITKSISKTCLTTLRWSLAILHRVMTPAFSTEEQQKLIESQSHLLYGLAQLDDTKMEKKIVVAFDNVLVKGNILKPYLSVVAKAESNERILVLWCFLVAALEGPAMTSLIQNDASFTDTYLQLLRTVVLSTKTKISSSVLRLCSTSLLRHVTKTEVTSLLLPAMQKAMLRAPEVSMLSVAYIISGIPFELSEFSAEIGKLCGPQLISKDEVCQEEAVVAVKNLAQQCSSPESVSALIKYLVGILNGSEGKLTTANQKLGVIRGLNSVSYHAVTGSGPVHKLSEQTVELLSPSLKSEVTEIVILATLSTLDRWCGRLTLEVPKSFLECVQNGFTLKATSSPVKMAYLQCLLSALQGCSSIDGSGVVPLIVKTIGKITTGDVQQPSAIAESLVAVCVAFRMAVIGVSDEKLSAVLASILQCEKLPFFSERFLAQANDNAYLLVLRLIELMVLENPLPTTLQYSIISFPLLKSFCHSKREVRQRAFITTKKLVSTLEGDAIATRVIGDFSEFVASHVTVLPVAPPTTTAGGDQPISDAGARLVDQSQCGRYLCDALRALASGSRGQTDEAAALAEKLLVPTHLPLIVSANPDIWCTLLNAMKVLVDALNIESLLRSLIITYSEKKETKQEVLSSISTIVTLFPSLATPIIMNRCLQAFENNAIIHVTKQEFGIFMTPEGEVYNKEAIESITNSLVEDKNIRRENKLYSYKEQMFEIELKKELEKKKGKNKESNEPQLTPKQKEVLASQLKQEAVVRERVAKLYNALSDSCDLVSIFLDDRVRKENAETIDDLLAPSMARLVTAINKLAGSHLGSKIGVEVSTKFCESAVPNHYLGLSVAYVNLRYVNPPCGLPTAWTEEPLIKATERVINECYHYINPKAGEDDDDSAYIELTALEKAELQSRLSTIFFNLLFPLVRRIILESKEDSVSRLCVKRCFQLINTYCETKGDIDTRFYVKHLPLPQILETCVTYIQQNAGNEALATKTLVNVCMSVYGAHGCPSADIDEVSVLLNALYLTEVGSRIVALQGLGVWQIVLRRLCESNADHRLLITRHIWRVQFDVEEEVQKLAEKLFVDLRLQPLPALCTIFIPDACHEAESVREAASSAIASLAKIFPNELQNILNLLVQTYCDNSVTSEPIKDNFGRIIDEHRIDPFEVRLGVGLTIKKVAPLFEKRHVMEVMRLLVPTALSDSNTLVQRLMVETGVTVVNIHGKDYINELLTLFEDYLDSAPSTQSTDIVRQSVVILMGTLAQHLDKDDVKVRPIISKLLELLSVPSQQVQEAVATCLPPLVPSIKDDAPQMVKKLLHLLLDSENYGERRGAAHGLAGLVKGLGILSLKQLEIMSTLTEAVQDKTNMRRKEGALFAFEMLCNTLGRLFEPYIVNILPHLLLCFGDKNKFVREATENTARAVMQRLTAHGVKLTLPSLLNGLENESWRTKSGSVELLGAMAYCAPKQLSSCLPSIVPKLIEVLSDSHPRVQDAGAQALRQIGSVIRNPEIQAIVPVLLDALQDPGRKTASSLVTLLATRFVHFIDAPSLALMMPVVQRAFQDRSTETRKMAAQIIGNMYSLTDHKDLAPYLPSIIPGLKQCLLDPVPEVRGVSARALGAMIKSTGEACFDDLVPWLMQTLTSEVSPVDRSGAAQGLSEVLGGMGAAKLASLMPELIQTAEMPDIPPHVKDGYIMMFIYLPLVFQKDFTPYIGQIIPPILKALADENEFVRDTALKAGQRIVSMYAETALVLLLPELENGLFDDNWRIRYASVQLLGDLLYKVSGVSGKMTTETADEDDNFGTEHSHRAVVDALGVERRNRVLSGLYMGRMDTSLMVRQASLHVWKIVVTNTPRTLREILPMLFSLLLGFLASQSSEKQQIAARTLGDLVRKLGERVLPEIVPILERGLDSEVADQRRGVCIGLSEIIDSTSKQMVMTFFDNLVPTVRRALCDPLREVRVAAAKTFGSLHSCCGSKALEDILSPLLKNLGSNDAELAEYTLDGLRQVMTLNSRVVLPYLVPQLTTPPVNTRALSYVSSVAGDALAKHLPKILPALLGALSTSLDTPQEPKELEYCQTVVLAVVDPDGVRLIVECLLESTKESDVRARRAAISLLCALCIHSKAPLDSLLPQLLRDLIHLYLDTDRNVLLLAAETLSAVIKTVDPAIQKDLVGDLRQAIRFAVSDLKDQTELPGFCQEKGIHPILPIFREALLGGAPELKEQAAQGLGEVIRLTDAGILKRSVITITGPLIRILGDRFASSVKMAVLDTLTMLLAKVGGQLRPFLPQLQTTFLKALNDGNRAVRLRAALGLAHLVTIHGKPESLITELHNAIKTQDDFSIKETTLFALRCVLSRLGSSDKMGDVARKTLLETLCKQQLQVILADDACRMAAAAALATLCIWLKEEEFAAVAKEHILHFDTTGDWLLRHFRVICLQVLLKEAPSRLMADSARRERLEKILLSYMTADRLPIILAGIRSTIYFLDYVLANDSAALSQPIVAAFAKCMNHQTNEAKQLVAQGAQWLSKQRNQRQQTEPLPAVFIRGLIPLLVNGTKEKNTVVKTNSELALVGLMSLRGGSTDMYQLCLNTLDAGARGSLEEVYSKSLQKLASQNEPRAEELDDTILLTG